jgi:Flp pilus assembly protein TadD
MLFTRNDFAGARTAYVAAVAREPNVAAHRIGLLRSLLRMDRWEEAQTEGAEAVEKFPDHGDLRGLYALALLRAGLIDEAIAEATKAWRQEPFGFYAALAYGRTQIWEGNTQRARTAFRRAIEIRPNDPDPWLGRFEASDNDTEEKDDLTAARKYLSLKPKGYPHDAELSGVANAVKNWQAYKDHYEKDAMLAAVGPIPEKELKRRERAGETFEARVPFKMRMGFVVVPVVLDGASFELIFDTGGGNGVLLTATAAKRLQKAKTKRVGEARVRGASGSEATTQYKAGTMKMGSLTLGAVPVDTVGDKPGLGDGILGGPAFDDYAVTIDFTKKELILRRGRNARAPKPTSGNYVVAQTFRYRGGKILLPLRAEGEQKIWSIVDSGSSVDMYSLRLATQLSADIPKENVVEATQAIAVGVGTTETSVRYRTFAKRMTLAYGHTGNNGTFFQPTSVGLSILDTQVSPAMGIEIGFLMGMPSIRLYDRITIDYPRRLLTLETKLPENGE